MISDAKFRKVSAACGYSQREQAIARALLRGAGDAGASRAELKALLLKAFEVAAK